MAINLWIRATLITFHSCMLHINDGHSTFTQYINCYAFNGFSTYWRYFPIEKFIVSAVDGPSVVSSFWKSPTAIDNRLQRLSDLARLDYDGESKVRLQWDRLQCWQVSGKCKDGTIDEDVCRNEKKTTLNKTVVNRRKVFSHHLYFVRFQPRN